MFNATRYLYVEMLHVLGKITSIEKKFNGEWLNGGFEGLTGKDEWENGKKTETI